MFQVVNHSSLTFHSDRQSTEAGVRDRKTQQTQTSELQVTENGGQCPERRSVAEQTAAGTTTTAYVPDKEIDKKSLVKFLRFAEPLVAAACRHNNRTQAFSRYEQALTRRQDASWRLTHSLKHHTVDNEASAATVDVNCSGTTVSWLLKVVVGYGRRDGHENWCAHGGLLASWNLGARRLDAAKADWTYPAEACVTSLRCHPSQPAVFACGLHSGVVCVFSLSKRTTVEAEATEEAAGPGADYLLAASSHQHSHSEPVSQCRWITYATPEYKRPGHVLASSGFDGRILLWSIDDTTDAAAQKSSEQSLAQNKVPHLQLLRSMAITVACLPRTLRANAANTQRPAGVSALAFCRSGGGGVDAFVVGGETGALLHCNLHTHDLLSHGQQGERVFNPVVLCLAAQDACVLDVRACPHQRNLVVCASADGVVCVYNILRVQPVWRASVSPGLATACLWSPQRPLTVFALCTQPCIIVLNLRAVSDQNRINLPANTGTGVGIACSSGSSRSLAVCTSEGVVHVYTVPEALMHADRAELTALQALARVENAA